jgi:hypothetical protein
MKTNPELEPLLGLLRLQLTFPAEHYLVESVGVCGAYVSGLNLR